MNAKILSSATNLFHSGKLAIADYKKLVAHFGS